MRLNIFLEQVFEVQKWIKNIYNDPIAKILAENCNLTKIQLETFLIEFLTEKMKENKLKNSIKSLFRTNGKISRGSFNRTLKQSQKNIISSIYTLLLLGYLGIFDSPALSSYVEVSNKLKTYIDSWNDIETLQSEGTRVAELLRTELEKILLEYAISKKSNLTW